MALSWNVPQLSLAGPGPGQEQAPRGVILTHESVAAFRRVEVRNLPLARSSLWCSVAGEKKNYVSSLRHDSSIWQTGMPGSENY